MRTDMLNRTSISWEQAYFSCCFETSSAFHENILLFCFRVYSDQSRTFFSAAEVLLRIYQNPIHLNGPAGGRGFSVGELHAASKTSSANGSHLNVWDFDISAPEFPQQKKRASLV